MFHRQDFRLAFWVGDMSKETINWTVYHFIVFLRDRTVHICRYFSLFGLWWWFLRSLDLQQFFLYDPVKNTLILTPFRSQLQPVTRGIFKDLGID